MALIGAKGGVAAGISASDIFKSLKDVKMRQAANYMRAGTYWCRIDAIKIDKNRKMAVFMAVEMTIVKVLDDDQGRGHKVGEGVCHMLMVANDSFLPNIKAMIAHIMDMRPEEIEARHAEQICALDQPLTGTVVDVYARAITTKAGKPFTEINYRREVPPAEAAATLDAETQEVYFPNDALTKMAGAA